MESATRTWCVKLNFLGGRGLPGWTQAPHPNMGAGAHYSSVLISGLILWGVVHTLRMMMMMMILMMMMIMMMKSSTFDAIVVVVVVVVVAVVIIETTSSEYDYYYPNKPETLTNPKPYDYYYS